MRRDPDTLEEALVRLKNQNKTIQSLTRYQLTEAARKFIKTDNPVIQIDLFSLFPDGKFLPDPLAKEILLQTGEDYLITPTTEKGGDIIWKYDADEGIYKSNGIPWIESIIEDVLDEKTKVNHINSVVKLTQILTYDMENKFRDEKHSNMLVVKNGTLEVLTRELKPFSKGYYAKQKINVKYDPEARCPKILNFLEEVIPDGIKTIQEWSGYLLLKSYPIHKSLMLIGPGRNGKGTLCNLWTLFIGEENVSNVSLYSLTNNRFSVGQLYTKLVNIAPDISSDEMKRTGIFKALCGGDRLECDKKHQNPFNFWNYAKLTFSTNQLPMTDDISPAFFSRWIILHFTKRFEGEDDKKNLIEELTTPDELSGFLNFALEGLDRLLKNGDFTDSKSSEEMQEIYEDIMDPITSFVNNCIYEDPEEKTLKDDVNFAYRSYCRRRGHVPKAKNTLSGELKNRIFGLTDSRPTINKKRVNVWNGIILKCGSTETCQGCQGCQGVLSSSPTNNISKYFLKSNNNTHDDPDNPDRARRRVKIVEEPD